MKKKDKPTIYIKSANKGKFTQWAKEHGHEGVTDAAIQEGLASKLSSVDKMAQSAKNAKSFKH